MILWRNSIIIKIIITTDSHSHGIFVNVTRFTDTGNLIQVTSTRRIRKQFRVTSKHCKWKNDSTNYTVLDNSALINITKWGQQCALGTRKKTTDPVMFLVLWTSWMINITSVNFIQVVRASGHSLVDLPIQWRGVANRNINRSKIFNVDPPALARCEEIVQ